MTPDEVLETFPFLTKREATIVSLREQGYKTREIAEQFSVTQRSIELYLDTIRTKVLEHRFSPS